MTFPRGFAVHQNLKTAFTQFDALLSELSQNGFTGYLQVGVSGSTGILFFKAGKVVLAFDNLNGQQRIGGGSAEATACMAKTQEGSIDVYALPEKLIVPLYELRRAQLKHQNLSSDFASLKGLISKIQTSGHNGCIEVTMNNANSVGLVVAKAKKPLLSGFWGNGQVTDDAESLNQLVNCVKKKGAKFSVYLQASPPSTQTPTSKATGLAGRQQIEIWEKIVGRIEETVDSMFSSGFFMNAFEYVLFEKADTAPALTAFGDKFQYSHGKILYSGNPKELHDTLGRCLSATVDDIAQKHPHQNAWVLVKNALRPIAETHAIAIQNYGFQTRCDLLTMTIYERVIALSIPVLGDKTTTFIDKQCTKKLKIEPKTLVVDHLWDLAQHIERNAALFISKENARDLRDKIEVLAD